MRNWIKIDRISAWVLFVSIIIYFITGYGITKGIISADFSTKFHLNILPMITLLAFTLHTSFAIHLAFRRWRIWNNLSATILVLFFVTFLSSFLYIDRFYQTKKSSDISSVSPTPVTAQNSVNQAVATPAVKIFTTAELAKYNGQNGQSAYVGVDGVVYDLTNVFRSGAHFQHVAGTDLTGEFYSYHAKSALSRYPVVGKLE